jgi:hypothetical protein
MLIGIDDTDSLQGMRHAPFFLRKETCTKENAAEVSKKCW